MKNSKSQNPILMCFIGILLEFGFWDMLKFAIYSQLELNDANMEKINQFSLKIIDDIYANLLFENKKTNKVSGKIIEQQFQYQDNYLLMITADCPFEESLYIYYLNHNLQIIDSAKISQIYTGGILGDVKANADTLTFTFFDDEDNWQIKILPQPIRAFSLGFGSLPKRPFSIGGLRYLNVRNL